ncbi:MAG: hypothetical protein AABY83_12840 [Pseudomonadota bacterium]
MLTSQRGAFLIQLLIMLAIIGILTVLTVPNLSAILVRQDLESGQNTLIQTLHKAKWLARSHGTTVDINIAQDTYLINLTSANNSVNETIRLPERTRVTQAIAMRVSPAGIIAMAPTTTQAAVNPDITASALDISNREEMSITLASTHDQPKPNASNAQNTPDAATTRTITISPFGSIAGI